MKCFKIRALGHKVGFIAICQASFRFPLAKARRIWFGVDVTVYAISLSRKLKCTCPTPSQQKRVTGMWSGEEGSCSSSGHQFPLRGLLPPMQTPHELAAPGVPRTLQLGQHSKCESTQPLLPPKCTHGYKTDSPDTRDPLCELRDADMWIMFLPSFWVIPFLPQNHCPSAFPLHPSPTRPTSWVMLLNPF